MKIFEIVSKKFRKFIEEPQLPLKATNVSSGYDFYSNEEIILEHGQQHIFWTDVCARLAINEILFVIPRSSVGIKKNVMLANTVGNIDADYYGNPDNGGNIAICIYNYGLNPVKINKGERIAQGLILLQSHRAVREGTEMNQDKIREGGLGSTGE